LSSKYIFLLLIYVVQKHLLKAMRVLLEAVRTILEAVRVLARKIE
jgi:hypothetical protein